MSLYFSLLPLVLGPWLSLAGVNPPGHACLFLAVGSKRLLLKLRSQTLGFRALLYRQLCVLYHTHTGGLMSLVNESQLRCVGAIAGAQA